MEQTLDYVTLGIASLAVLIIIYGVVLGMVELIAEETKRFRKGAERRLLFEDIRTDIGFHLLLGLEFLIAADIVRSVLSPTLEELAVLGGIVAIRTVLSYFLGKEIKQNSRAPHG